MVGPWYVVVENGRTPRKAHGSLELARTEARRLFDLHHGERWVRILETCETLDAKVLRSGTGKLIPVRLLKRRQVTAIA